MWTSEWRQPTESGERGQVPFTVATVSGRTVRRRPRRWRRSESSGHPTAARQRTWSTAYTRGHSVTEPVVVTGDSIKYILYRVSAKSRRSYVIQSVCIANTFFQMFEQKLELGIRFFLKFVFLHELPIWQCYFRSPQPK